MQQQTAIGSDALVSTSYGVIGAERFVTVTPSL